MRETPIDTFQRYLTDNSQRVTDRRLLVAEITLRMDHPFGREDIFREVNRIQSQFLIGRATVERTLESLVRAEMIAVGRNGVIYFPMRRYFDED